MKQKNTFFVNLFRNSQLTNRHIAIVIARLDLKWETLGGGMIGVAGINGDNQEEVDAFFELVDEVSKALL
jgi:hypothetical protein